MSQTVQNDSSADGPSCFDSGRMFLNAKQCFSIKSTGVKEGNGEKFSVQLWFCPETLAAKSTES